MNISRQHAKITYNFDLGEAGNDTCLGPLRNMPPSMMPAYSCSQYLFVVLQGVFELTVMGKNGVTVNGVLHTPSSASQQLYTQDFLQVGEQKFYFLLPKGVSR